MNKNNTKTCIIVLGMHRSGTSAVTGLLEKFGIYLGNKLLEANIGNLKGYFENEIFVEFNKEVLLDLNSYHEDIEFNFYSIKNIDKYVDKLCDIIETEFKNVNIFAIKDPRISLLFPIYQKAMEKKGIDIKIIRPIREPSEVAVSFKKASDIEYEHSFALWINYNLLAEFYTRDMEKLYITYNDLVYNTKETLFRISNFINKPLNDGIDLFIDKKLYRSKKENLNINLELYNFAYNIYHNLSSSKNIKIKKLYQEYKSLIQKNDFIKDYYKKKYLIVSKENIKKDFIVKLKYNELKYLQYLKDKKIAIFGLGKAGQTIYNFLKNYKLDDYIKYFIDDNIKGKYEGISIINTEKFLKQYQKEIDIVVFGKYQHLNPNLLSNITIPYERLEILETDYV